MTEYSREELEEKYAWLADRLWDICQPPGLEEEFAPLLQDRYRILAAFRRRYLSDSGGDKDEQ